MESSMNPGLAHPTDVELVARCLRGDREAYGSIVIRYQNLVCALAYSACGNVARSEDIAQDVFIAAWKQLGQLREPGKLKSWLCGIARNRIQNVIRSERREATAGAEPLDNATTAEGGAATPSEHAISEEEQALVWSALEQMPENYREPLVLFYREDQSIQQVAGALELSEDAVKQRLSRGRALLKDQVAALVEGTLGSTRPGKTLAVAVLAALPAALPGVAAAATAGAAAKGSSAAKAVAASSLGGILLGPLVGILGAWFGVRMGMRNARSPRERQFMVRIAWMTMGMVVAFTAGLLVFIGWGKSIAREHPTAMAVALGVFILGYCFAMLGLITWSNRRIRQIQLEEGTFKEPAQALRDKDGRLNKSAICWSYGAGVGGLVIGFSMLPWQSGDWLSGGIIAASGLVVFLAAVTATLRNPAGQGKHALIALSLLGLLWLGLVNWRIDVWFPNLPEKPDLRRLVLIGINDLSLLIYGVTLLTLRLSRPSSEQPSA